MTHLETRETGDRYRAEVGPAPAGGLRRFDDTPALLVEPDTNSPPRRHHRIVVRRRLDRNLLGSARGSAYGGSDEVRTAEPGPHHVRLALGVSLAVVRVLSCESALELAVAHGQRGAGAQPVLEGQLVVPAGRQTRNAGPSGCAEPNRAAITRPDSPAAIPARSPHAPQRPDSPSADAGTRPDTAGETEEPLDPRHRHSQRPPDPTQRLTTPPPPPQQVLLLNAQPHPTDSQPTLHRHIVANLD